MRVAFAAVISLGLVLSLPLTSAQPGVPEVVNISFPMAQPILEAAGDDLPAEMKNLSPAGLQTAWAGWVIRHDQEMRARLLRGEEDTLVNFLLFGISFTHQPRLHAMDLVHLAPGQGSSWPRANSSPDAALFFKRVDDLLRGLAKPGDNERLQFLARLVQGQGFHPGKAYATHPDLAERDRLKAFVLAQAARMVREQENFEKEFEEAQSLEDRTQDFAERSELYRTRGLSFDTSLWPNMALEEALKAMQRRGLLTPGSVRRAAVVGPGLDFTDKGAGYDFYPQQTIQCFALVDTLLRLGLAHVGQLELTTFDISPRVNDHLRRARSRAQRGEGYVVQLPRPSQVPWKPEATGYWRRFGDCIGTPVEAIHPPALAGSVESRAVRIRPAIVSMITPVNLNIVLQHLDLPPQKGFDLIIATNVFVYYNAFEQLLAVANMQRMLRPGGFLLSNNSLPLLNSSPMQSVDYLSVLYSDLPDDGDVIVWYQRSQRAPE